MKHYMIHYSRKEQLADFSPKFTTVEDQRIEDLRNSGVLESFYEDTAWDEAWILIHLPSKLDVLEILANFAYLFPERIKISEVFN